MEASTALLRHSDRAGCQVAGLFPAWSKCLAGPDWTNDATLFLIYMVSIAWAHVDINVAYLSYGCGRRGGSGRFIFAAEQMRRRRSVNLLV